MHDAAIIFNFAAGLIGLLLVIVPFNRRLNRVEDSKAIGGPKVKFVRLHPQALVPTYARHGDAGADVYSVEDVKFQSGEWKLVKCGFAMELPDGWEAQVRSRSGLAQKNGICVFNSPGTIDSGYRGEVGVILINHGPPQTLKVGSRVAQMVIKPAPQARFEVVAKLSASERGTGGFGSSGGVLS